MKIESIFILRLNKVLSIHWDINYQVLGPKSSFCCFKVPIKPIRFQNSNLKPFYLNIFYIKLKFLLKYSCMQRQKKWNWNFIGFQVWISLSLVWFTCCWLRALSFLSVSGTSFELWFQALNIYFWSGYCWDTHKIAHSQIDVAVRIRPIPYIIFLLIHSFQFPSQMRSVCV